jgi:flagellar assembly factor FliW
MESQVNTITISTSQFGEIQISHDQVFDFPDGILGFENLNKYILITDEDTEPFKWLISLDEPSIGFPLLSPYYIDYEYDINRIIDSSNQILFAVVTLQNENKRITANLKAPIIIDLENMQGEQILLPTEKYSTSFEIKVNDENQRS